MPTRVEAFDIAGPEATEPSSEEIVPIGDKPLPTEEEKLTVEQPPLEPQIAEIPAIEMPEVEPYATEREVTFRIDDSTLPPMEKAVTFWVDKVPPIYRSRFDKPSALAREGGTKKTEDAVLLALEWLKREQNPDGSWGEGRRKTCMAVLSLQLLGHGEDSEVKAALRVMKGKDAAGNFNFDLDWDKIRGFGYVLYGWYYITQAMFQSPDPECWAYLNPRFSKMLTEKQRNDGSWGYPAQGQENYGPVYPTVLGCLMLEVYYRHLPTYRPVSAVPATAAAP